jgi:hypothetical protein
MKWGKRNAASPAIARLPCKICVIRFVGTSSYRCKFSAYMKCFQLFRQPSAAASGAAARAPLRSASARRTIRILASLAVRKGMYQEAEPDMLKALPLAGNRSAPIATLGHIYAVSGQKAKAMKGTQNPFGQQAPAFLRHRDRVCRPR